MRPRVARAVPSHLRCPARSPPAPPRPTALPRSTGRRRPADRHREQRPRMPAAPRRTHAGRARQLSRRLGRDLTPERDGDEAAASYQSAVSALTRLPASSADSAPVRLLRHRAAATSTRATADTTNSGTDRTSSAAVDIRVAGDDRVELGVPPRRVGLRRGEVLRAPVPEAAVDVHGDPATAPGPRPPVVDGTSQPAWRRRGSAAPTRAAAAATAAQAPCPVGPCAAARVVLPRCWPAVPVAGLPDATGGAQARRPLTARPRWRRPPPRET